MNRNLYLNFVAAIVAILNTLGILPIWVQLTNDATKRVGRKIAYIVTGTTVYLVGFFINIIN